MNIIITGAGTGLGAELAKIYAREGNHIILLGRTKEKLLNTKTEIVNNGGSAEIHICDISNPSQIQELISTIDMSNVKKLINNAGVGAFGPLESLSIEDINKVIDINVKGTIYLTKAILPYFKKKNSGSILNIISTAGLRGKINESVYVASKFAIRGFSESLQKELENTKVTITAVYMGGMLTPFWDNSTHIKDKSRLKLPQHVSSLIFEKDDGRNEIVID